MRPRPGPLVLAALAVAACALGAAPSSAAAARPNIVVFVLDDISAIDGRWWAHLPNIRETFYGPRATEFAYHDAETELCCPARAGLLSGLHTWHHGVAGNHGADFRAEGTLAPTLQAAGYTTILAGKYFNGMYGIVGTYGRALGWDWFDGGDGGYFGYRLYSHSPSQPEPVRVHYGSDPADYSTDVIRELAIAHLRAAPPDRPVLAWIAPYAPHNDKGEQDPEKLSSALPAPRHASSAACDAIAPWGPPSYNATMSDPPSRVRYKAPLPWPDGYPLQRQCLSLLAVDELVGAVVGELRAQGRLADTVLVFTGDNGMNYGAHKLLGKIDPYAERVPLSIVLPRDLRTSRTPRRVDEQVVNIDVPVTLAALAGARLGPYARGQTAPDGVSLVPLLRGRSSTLGRDAVIQDHLVGTGWLALRTSATSPLARQGCALAASGGCRWHYIERGDFVELYDGSNGPCWTWTPVEPGDPCELSNLGHDPAYAALVDALHRRLHELRAD